MKKLLLFSFVMLFSAQFAFADDDWFEKDLSNMANDVKMEVLKLYSDTEQGAASMRINIINTSNMLASAIENKATEVERNKYITQMTNEIVTLGDDTKMAYSKIMAKAAGMSKRLKKDICDDDFDERHGKMFTAHGVKTVYDLLDESGIEKPSKQQISATYGKQIMKADNDLKNAYYKYSGFWMANIKSGPEFEKAKSDYAAAVRSVVTLAANVYASELSKLTPEQIAKVASERQRMNSKQVNKINEKAKENKAEINNAMNKVK